LIGSGLIGELSSLFQFIHLAMKVLYDHQIFEHQNIGGISRYFFELINAFQGKPGIETELSLIYSNNEYIKHLNGIAPRVGYSDRLKAFLGGINFRGKSKIFDFKNKLVPTKTHDQLNLEHTIKTLQEGNFDIFHPTYYDTYFLEYLGDKPLVITVYDLIHQIFGEYFSPNDIDKSQELLTTASAIIAISESTKRDLVNIFNVNEQKVWVTHLASSLDTCDEMTRSNFFLPDQYVLFVGGRWAYKNFYFFAQMFGKISQQFPYLSLVCTGSPFSKNEDLFLKKIGIRDRTYSYFVNDNELSYLYQNAVCFVFPSLYEGFGIPVLEAFHSNCPVIISNTSSLPEVAGDAAMVFEPKDPASLFNALKKIVTDKLFREQLVHKGKERLACFSWENTAEKTFNIYKAVLQ
jgi:glycosyltransferase involved in cell wall biosynthesis